MSVKNPAIVYVKYDNGAVEFYDNEGNQSDPNNLSDFTTLVSPNGKIGWQIADGVSAITNVTIDSGEEIFKKLPFEKNGDWEAKLDNKESLEAKYSITIVTTEAKESITVDPILRLDP